MDAHPVPAANCRNCNGLLTGSFCAQCGQAADVHVPSTAELVHELFEGLTHSDSRLWRTLKDLWFKPGMLTVEFVAGRRVAFLPPVRLYLVLSVIFFLTASLSHQSLVIITAGNGQLNIIDQEKSTEACDRIHWDGESSAVWEPRARHACQQVFRDRGAALMHVALGTFPKVMFLFLPLIAFLHMLLYWRPRHRYAIDLLFFIHVHAFFFSALTLAELASEVGKAWSGTSGATDLLIDLLLWALPLYTLLAMKRVFQRGWLNTVVKAAALSAIYLVVMSVTVAAVFVYAVLQL
jgi:hypothetical protein